MSMNKFWTDISRYGAVHKAQQGNTGSEQRCLIIYVHGLFGDCTKTWGTMPEWVLKNAAVDTDVISFAYPSRSWQRTSINQAADDLKAWLETEFHHHRHLIFVTHSTGGLIVKLMLKDAADSLQQESKKGHDLARADSLWLRTRRVLNIAVPHFGGSPFVSRAGKYVYLGYYTVLGPFFGLTRFITQGGKDWGKNEIIPALSWQNPQLITLEKDFVRYQRQSKNFNQPCPIIQDVRAKTDLSVPFETNIESRQIFIRGTHKSIKIPKRINAPIVSIVADLARRYTADMGVDVVDGSLRRIELVNRSSATRQLIETTVCGIGSDLDKPKPNFVSASFGTQAEIADMIIESIYKPSDQPRQLVLTGAAGVGKSSVMRMIAWQLGLRYLSNPRNKDPVPLFIPLQQITADQVDDTTYSWDTMWQWWLDWGESMFPELTWDPQWLEKNFKKYGVAIILDGLDDFLHNHRLVSFSSVTKLLRDAVAQYSENPNFTMVIGVRNTIHGIERLVSDPKDIFEIMRLSIAQAKEVYPSCQSWIDQVEDKDLLDFILTPLILSNYEPDPNCEISEGPSNQAALLCQTMRTALQRSRLIGMQNHNNHAIEIDHLGRAMMFIAWLFFHKARGEISTDILRKEASQLRQRWEHFFEQVQKDDENFYLEAILPIREELVLGFEVLQQPETCNALVQRTLFVPTGPNSVRFMHRQWQEFLLGQYLAFCIRMHHFDELGFAAFHSRIYRIAGDSFGNRIVTEGCVQALFKNWHEHHNTYVTGNVIAFLTWTRTAIEPMALQLLLSQVAEFERLSRLVLLGGLGYRVLTDQTNDVSLKDLRRALLPKLREFSDPESAPVDDSVACSLSWMYRKAFAEIFNLDHPENPWPGIGFEDDETLKALPMVCTVRGDKFILDERARSLQVAFLVPIQEAFNDPKLAIRAVHYLYYLVIARKHDVHIVGLSQDLPVLLSEGSPFQRIIESFKWVPELMELYRRCQSFHHQIDATVG